jgi:hypothetical protein
MVVVRTYTIFAEMLNIIGEEKCFAPQIEELRLGALAITEAVLYIKQHSVNCIPAAMYAMTIYDPKLFPPDEAERFVSDLFKDAKKMDQANSNEIREYILFLYHRFITQKETGGEWTEPLLDFLKEYPQA